MNRTIIVVGFCAAFVVVGFLCCSCSDGYGDDSYGIGSYYCMSHKKCGCDMLL